MNDAQILYLSTCFQINVVNHLLKNAAILYHIWKYWHTPKNHAFAMIIVLAFSLYEECTEGKIELDWKIEKNKRVNFFRIQIKVKRTDAHLQPQKATLSW